MISPAGVLSVLPRVQRLKMGQAMAGQAARVWADEVTVHVSIGGQLVKTMPSSLDAEDLAELRMRGAAPAGPPPAMPAPARADALPAGTVIEVDRAVDASGIADLAGHKVKVGAELARSKVTLRLDGHLIHVIAGGVLAKTLPSPVPAGDRARLRGARIAGQPAARARLPARSASSARSPGTASSWSPASGSASAPPTPGRSSPSTSRTPTSALPATAPRYPSTPATSSAPSTGGEPRSTPRNPKPCPACPETVNQVVSRSCQGCPETTHHTRPANTDHPGQLQMTPTFRPAHSLKSLAN